MLFFNCLITQDMPLFLLTNSNPCTLRKLVYFGFDQLAIFVIKVLSNEMLLNGRDPM